MLCVASSRGGDFDIDLYTGEGILDRSIGNKKLCGKIARERRKTKGGDDGGDGSSNPAWTLRRN